MAVVTFETIGRVGLLTLNRPESRNAVNPELAQALEGAIDELEASDGVWAGVLTGAGPSFCAGADLRVVATGEVNALGTMRGGWGGIVRRERAKPLIAAVEGSALGGGCEIALACDLITAGRSARFGLPEVTHSLLATAGGLVRLPHAIPRNFAMEMALTGVPIDATRAYELGLVNRVCENGQAVTAALELASTIASNAPLAVQATRRVLLGVVGSEERDVWRRGWQETKQIFATEDFKEGPRAFVERRPPVWKGR